MTHITVWMCWVCFIYVCYICAWCSVCRRLLLALCDGRREGKEGMCVSMTTHLLVALYKARRGGRERRANRYWQGTLWNKGRPMLPADCNSTSCAASERSRHADSVRCYATYWSPSHSFIVLRIPHWTDRPGKAAGCHANGRHSAPTTHPEGHVTHPQTQRTCSSIRQTGPNAERLKPNRVKQNTLGVWDWKKSTCCWIVPWKLNLQCLIILKIIKNSVSVEANARRI